MALPHNFYMCGDDVAGQIGRHGSAAVTNGHKRAKFAVKVQGLKSAIVARRMQVTPQVYTRPSAATNVFDDATHSLFQFSYLYASICCSSWWQFEVIWLFNSGCAQK